MTESIIDTDILSFYFKGDIKIIDQFNNDLKEFDQINISIITYYEILAGLKFKKAQKKFKSLKNLLPTTISFICRKSPLKDQEAFMHTLSKIGITIGTSDLLIAGIALDNPLTLITNNEKHFEPIKGLKIENLKK